MRYTAVHRAFLQSGPAVDASCADIGAWLRLQSYASSDGVEHPALTGARDWPSRKWLVLANVERAEVDGVVAAGLAVWRETDLEVLGFDAAGLDTIKARRLGGKKAGRGRPNSSPNSSTHRPRLADKQLSDGSSEPLSSPLPSSPSQTSPAEESSEPARPPASEPAILTFPTVGKGPKTWDLTRTQLDEWARLFPGVDVEQSMRTALAYFTATPVKRKTSAGLPRALVRWLAGDQDRGARREPTRDPRTGYTPAVVQTRVSGEVAI